KALALAFASTGAAEQATTRWSSSIGAGPSEQETAKWSTAEASRGAEQQTTRRSTSGSSSGAEQPTTKPSASGATNAQTLGAPVDYGTATLVAPTTRPGRGRMGLAA